MAKFAHALAVLVVASLAPAAAQTPEPVSVSLTDYAFSPPTLSLTAGVTYHLHFTNSGSKNHNFTAAEFFAASQIAADDQAKIKKGSVAVDSGQTVDIAVTAGPAGNYAFTCTHFMHNMMGMHGTITVQ
jgi:plastocyanin